LAFLFEYVGSFLVWLFRVYLVLFLIVVMFGFVNISQVISWEDHRWNDFTIVIKRELL